MSKLNYFNSSASEADIEKIHLFYNINGVNNADNGKYDEALEFFNKAIKINPKDAVSYFNRASVKMHLGDIKGARLDFKKAEKFKITDKYD